MTPVTTTTHSNTPGWDIIDWLRSYARLSLWLVPLLMLLHGYEFGMIAWRYELSPSLLTMLVRALGYDLLVAGLWILIGGILYMLWRLAGRGFATTLIIGLNVLLIIAYVGLIEYFLITQVPLGAELFGYSWSDITATVRTSTDFSLRAWLPFICAPVLYGVMLWFGRHWHWRAGTLKLCTIIILVLAILFWPLYPRQSVLTSERKSALAANKLAAFVNNSLVYAGDRGRSPVEQVDYQPKGEYPLLHAADHEDVLVPFFRQADAPPNIVIIAVEGYGRDFTPGQRYGGFTPFLGQLMQEGLYFPNFIALSGRSFGFLPSIIGSLPPAEHGFMDLGSRMPHHDTLITLLNRNDYHTAYFVGFSSNFDNIDVFLERQNIDFMLNEGMFGPSYEKMDVIEGGFTWGYADRDMYQRAFGHLENVPSDQPRLDMFHTVNLHEPFIIPEPAKWHQAVTDRLAELDPPAAVEATVRRHKDIFAALLYSDDALRYLFEQYRRRSDFERTIFIITGDHRLIPIPEADRIDRFSVPLIIWSPLLKGSGRIEAVSTHLDLVPSLTAYLRENYGLEFPRQVHWLGQGIDTHREFRSRRTAALMRTKNSLNDFLAGEYFLSGNDLFRLLPGLLLEPVRDKNLKKEIANGFTRFRAMNDYVTQNDKLTPDALSVADTERAKEEALLNKLQLANKSPEQLFEYARQAAFDQRYEETRLIGRRVLRDHPNYHDMRVLLGRAYSWNGEYDKAREYFRDVIRRNPLYGDAYSALADAERWSGQPEDAIQVLERGLKQLPDNTALLLQKAKILNQVEQPQAALHVINDLLRTDPENEQARELRQRLLARTTVDER